MTASAPSRSRPVLMLALTIVVVLGEFAFLNSVYRLDEDVETQRIAQAQVTGALQSWQPGADTRAVTDAVAALDPDVDGVGELRSLTRAWAADPDATGLGRLDAANDEVALAMAAQRDGADVRVQVILATLLVVVSLGWFFWFRRLVRRHRELERSLIERQALDAGERRLLALVQNSVDLVAVLEPDSTASFVSPSSASVLGQAPEDLVGRRFVDLLAPRDVPRFISLLSGSREGDQEVSVRTTHADGRELVLEGTVTNLLTDPAVAGWVLTIRDVTDRQALQDELSHQAFHDSLTGLANRQLFADRLSHALRRRWSQPLVVAFLDLDDFKNVNDSLGHGTGDELLRAVAERIESSVREGDTAARLGGDEFAILMEDADLDAAREVADRLVADLTLPVAVGDTLHSVRASIGMALAIPGEADPEETLRNADVAMYWAKDRGKGTVAVYDAGLHAIALERMALRSELQRAIREGELALHYQPTVDLDTQTIIGFEALVRWQHPEHGLLPPSEFLPVAEESGLIVPLGSWVLREACRAGAQLQTETSRPSMSVNVAAHQLARPDFAEEVFAVLTETGLPADRLVLEMTESTLLADLEGTAVALHLLRDRGVRVAIDDFGTGYSSLSYLSQLPVDVLKVDKSFIDRVGSDSDTTLVETIITMSHSMRLTTVAEGVEVREQADWLQQASCSLGQGYLWSRPVELSVAQELLAHGPAATATVAAQA